MLGTKQSSCSLIRHERGSTLIEFSLVAPIMILLLFGIIEYSLVMYGTAVLESATSNTARLGKTGYTEEGVSREDMLHDMVEERSAGLLDISQLTITTKVYGEFADVGEPEAFNDQNNNGSHDSGEPYDDVNGNGQWDSDMGASGVGGARQVVVYTVTYPWQLQTPVIAQLLGDEDGIFTLTSSMVVRNEPYDTTVLGN